MIIIYLFVIAATLVIFYYFFTNHDHHVTKSEQNVTKSEQNATNVPENVAKSGENVEKPVISRPALKRRNTSFDGADVMTVNGSGNICVAIFKNPLDHKTHFFRTRLKGKAFMNAQIASIK